MRVQAITALLLGGLLAGAGCARPQPIVLHPVASASSTVRTHAARPRPPTPAVRTASCAPSAATASGASLPDKEALFRAFTAEEAAAAGRPAEPAPGQACHKRS